jgi:protein-tyrosine kinase
MDNIRQAVERARSGQTANPNLLENKGIPLRRPDSGVGQGDAARPSEEVVLDSRHLLSRRIVCHDGADQRSRPYDMLRIQVLVSMAHQGWKVVGITSPTPGCGKTLTAINLALSIARQPEQSVLLVDADLQKPQVADCLGLKNPTGGTLALLQNRTTLRDATISVRTESNHRLTVLPTASTRQSSELMGSRTMRNLFQDLKRAYQSHVIIVDLPPMLTGDDVIALLPQLDSVLLLAAVGQTKASDIEECMRHLKSSQLLRLVVNKSTEPTSMYYYY